MLRGGLPRFFIRQQNSFCSSGGGYRISKQSLLHDENVRSLSIEILVIEIGSNWVAQCRANRPLTKLGRSSNRMQSSILLVWTNNPATSNAPKELPLFAARKTRIRKNMDTVMCMQIYILYVARGNG